MTDLHVREATEGDWDMPVVELVEERRVVGIVYLDGIDLFAEFNLDDEGEAWSFDVGDLQRALDTARAMLAPEGTDALEERADLGGKHPVDVLAQAFDARAAHRAEEDEGFYPVAVAEAIIRAATELDLAVVSLEAFTFSEGWVEVIAGSATDLGETHDGEPWPVFKAGCNVLAGSVLDKWKTDERIVVSVEVADRDGDRFVL